MSREVKIGQGSYGEVTIVNGTAMKKFMKLSHLVQEYIALKILEDCQYVVKCTGVNFAQLQLQMELYDMSLRNWLERDGGQREQIIHDILMGLVELHDRNIAHGDIKPSNILLRKQPLKAVLGDCGFASIAKYAKIERTAPGHRDPVIEHDLYHDIFSFGICYLELTHGIRMSHQPSYLELDTIINNKIGSKFQRKILRGCFNADREQRFTARSLLNLLYHETPLVWTNNLNNSVTVPFSPVEIKQVQDFITKWSDHFELNRAKKGFGAVLSFLRPSTMKHYKFYSGVTMLILSAMFGKSGVNEEHVLHMCNNVFVLDDVYAAIYQLLQDPVFINIIMSPPKLSSLL